MKVKIYARVSTDDKDQDPERQLIKNRQYAELHNHTILEEIVEHHTGDSNPFERPEGKRLLEGGTEGIIIFSMDRFTRQHPVKVIQLIQNLKDRGIKVISITEPAFNMESDFAEVLLYLISWFNNYFLLKLKKDIKSGLDRAKAEGKTFGRPKKEFNRYRAYQLIFIEKRSLGSVAKDLGVSKATLHRFKRVAMKNPGLFINNPPGVNIG